MSDDLLKASLSVSVTSETFEFQHSPRFGQVKNITIFNML